MSRFFHWLRMRLDQASYELGRYMAQATNTDLMSFKLVRLLKERDAAREALLNALSAAPKG